VELEKGSVDVYEDSMAIVAKLKVLLPWKSGGEKALTTKNPLTAL
jgi:hypothetical protein